MAKARHMSESFGEDYTFPRLLGGLIRIAEKPEHLRPLALAAYSRVMTAIDQRVRAMLLAIVERQALEHMLAGADVMRHRHIGRPAGVMRFEKKPPIAKPFRQPEQLFDKVMAKCSRAA